MNIEGCFLGSVVLLRDQKCHLIENLHFMETLIPFTAANVCCSFQLLESLPKMCSLTVSSYLFIFKALFKCTEGFLFRTCI